MATAIAPAQPAPDTSRSGAVSEGIRAAVADLVHGYARIVRERRGKACGALFTQDAVYEIRETDQAAGPGAYIVRNRLEGAQAIADHVGASSGSAVQVFPMIHNLLIEASGDAVSSNCLMAAATIPAGNEVLGVYDDTFARQDDRWLFASRIYTIHDSSWKRAARRDTYCGSGE